MMFSTSSTLIAPLASTRDVGQHAGRFRWRMESTCVAELRARRLTTLGTSPVAWNVCTIRITSWAIATCAWSVEAPTWWVP